jgi:hypothetical protein
MLRKLLLNELLVAFLTLHNKKFTVIDMYFQLVAWKHHLAAIIGAIQWFHIAVFIVLLNLRSFYKLIAVAAGSLLMIAVLIVFLHVFAQCREIAIAIPTLN